MPQTWLELDFHGKSLEFVCEVRGRFFPRPARKLQKTEFDEDRFGQQYLRYRVVSNSIDPLPVAELCSTS